MSRPLARRTSAEVSDSTGRTLLIPLGSFEQHGPHLPLATDSVVAEAICADVAAARDVDVAPVLAYGASDEHRGFAGLLSLGTEATAATVSALVRSALEGWGTVILVSAHGGNAAAVQRAMTAAVAGPRVRAWFARDLGGDAHAGITETSVVLSIDPALVDHDQYPQEAVELPDDWFERSRTEGLRAVTSTGVLGAPSRASATYGHDLRRRWCVEIVALVDEAARA